MTRDQRYLALGVLVLAGGVVAACQSADPRRAVAEQFIDRLFVVIDQRAARELAVGVAAGKVDEEIRLKGDQAIDESTQKPRVTYRFVESRGDDGAEVTSMVYDLQIAPDGIEAFGRRLLLTLRRLPEGWRIANYTLDAAAGPD
jgi:hypothetical protein